MKCAYCDNEVHGKFCTKCGNRIDDTPAKDLEEGAGATMPLRQTDLHAYMQSAREQAPRNVEATFVSASQSEVMATPYGTMAVAERRASAFTAPTLERYPVTITCEAAVSSRRLYAIPILGYVIRAIMLVPHVVILYLLMLATMALQLVLWAPVLFTGRYPAFGYNVVSGTLRWGTRIGAYFYGLTDEYPPFSLSDEDYPVRVTFEVPSAHNRFWAVPVLGYLVKVIILIPHLIALYLLGLIAMVLSLVLWIPVLLNGKYPDFGFSFISGVLRWSVRVYSYFLGLTDQYPPFGFDA